MPKITRESLLEHLVEKQLNLLEKTVLDALFEKEWRKWTLSKSQEEDFKKYFIATTMKVLKIPKKKCLSNYEWFKANYGLNISKL